MCLNLCDETRVSADQYRNMFTNRHIGQVRTYSLFHENAPCLLQSQTLVKTTYLIKCVFLQKSKYLNQILYEQFKHVQRFDNEFQLFTLVLLMHYI